MTFLPGQSGNPTGRRKKTPEEQELIEMARAHSPQALATLVTIMKKGKTERDRMIAATAILERGYGKPVQPMDITQEHIYEIRDTPMNADEWQKSCIIEHEPEIIPESDSVN